MGILKHLIVTDLRHFWRPIVAWIALVAVSAFVSGVAPLVETPGMPAGPAQGAVWLLTAARLLLAATLTASIVQAHALVGTTAFWLTRPIPPMALMWAKFILAMGLFVLAPAAADVVVMLFYRVPPRDIALVVMESSVLRVALMTFFIAAAAFTSTLARFALVCGAALCALALTINVVVFLWTRRMERGAALVSVEPSQVFVATGASDATGALAGLLVFIAGGMVLLRTQYRRRSARQTVPLGLIVPVIAATVSGLWPWAVLRAAVPPPAWAAGTLTLMAHPDSVATDQSANAASEAQGSLVFIRARVFAGALPPGWLVSSRLVRATARLDDVTLENRVPGIGVTLPAGASDNGPAAQTLLGLLDVQAIGGFNMPRPASAPVLVVEREELPPRPVRASYRGEFDLDLLKLEVAAVVPLHRGGTFQDGPLRMVVDRSFYADRGALSGMVVDARISDARSSLERRPRPQLTLFLRNSAKREAVCGAFPVLGSEFPTPPLALGPWHLSFTWHAGFTAHTQRLHFPSAHQDMWLPSPVTEASPRVTVDESWLRDAQIVVIRSTAAGTVRRSLDLDGIRLSR